MENLKIMAEALRANAEALRILADTLSKSGIDPDRVDALFEAASEKDAEADGIEAKIKD